MSKPTDIPADVWDASQFVMGWEHRLMPDNALHLTEVVARAILAERERLAATISDQAEGERVLQRSARDAHTDRNDALVHMYCAQTLEQLAASIRKGGA